MEKLEVYAHINNGGVSFEVTNEQGPTIEVKASHFGNQTNHIKLHVDVEVLRRLADMFYKASTAEYSEEYVCAAKVPEKKVGNAQGAIEKQ
jgi:hypothetical protein